MSTIEAKPIAQEPPAVPRNKYAIPWRFLQHYPRLGPQDAHPTRWEFPAWLDNPGVPWLQELKRIYANPASFPASISPEAGLLLHSIVRNVRPRAALEIGSFLGVSTIWIGSALAECGGDASLYTIDDFGPMGAGPWRQQGIDEDRLPIVRASIERAGLSDRCRLSKGISWDVVGSLTGEIRDGGGVQLALLDGDHSRAGALRDFHAVEPLLNTGGYILLHDTFPDQCGGHMGPRFLVDRVNELGVGLYEACELHLAPLNYGMALLRRVG